MRTADAVPQDLTQELEETLALFSQLQLAMQEFTEALQQARYSLPRQRTGGTDDHMAQLWTQACARHWA